MKIQDLNIAFELTLIVLFEFLAQGRTNHDPSEFSYFNNFVVWEMQRATNENINFDVRVYKGKTNLIGLLQGLQSAVLVMQTAKNNHNQPE